MSDFYETFYGNKGLLKSYGDDVIIADSTTFRSPKLVTIGNHVAIDEHVIISTQAEIGDHVHISPSVSIIGGKDSKIVLEDFTFISAGSSIACGSNDFTKGGLVGPVIPKEYTIVNYTTVTFKRFSGAGMNVSILPGVTIAEGSVIGAGSVVTKDTEPWGIYLGVPAKRVGTRDKGEILKNIKLMGY